MKRAVAALAVAVLALAGCAAPDETTTYKTPDEMVKAAEKAGYACGEGARHSSEAGVRAFIVCPEGGEFSVYQNEEKQAEHVETVLFAKAVFKHDYTILQGSNWVATFPDANDTETMLKHMGGKAVEKLEG